MRMRGRCALDRLAAAAAFRFSAKTARMDFDHVAALRDDGLTEASRY